MFTSKVPLNLIITFDINGIILDNRAFSDLRQASPDHFPPKHLKGTKTKSQLKQNLFKTEGNKEILIGKKYNAKLSEMKNSYLPWRIYLIYVKENMRPVSTFSKLFPVSSKKKKYPVPYLHNTIIHPFYTPPPPPPHKKKKIAETLF